MSVRENQNDTDFSAFISIWFFEEQKHSLRDRTGNDAAVAFLYESVVLSANPEPIAKV
jgi:hypothetical protein